SLPVKSANARKVEAHHRTLNKKNRVDSNLLVKHSVSVSKLNNVCAACNKSLSDTSVNVKPHQTKRFKHQPKKEWKPIKRVWKPISKPVTKSKPQWQPTGRHFSLFEKQQVVQIVLWYLDLGCSRHMTGDRARLINFEEKFIGTVHFGNDEYAAIVGYGDYKLGDTIISRVYYVEGLKHNLFSVRQFCDGGLEVAFRQHSCHIRNYDMMDLLKGSRSTNLYSISLEMICCQLLQFLAYKSLFNEVMVIGIVGFVSSEFGTLNELVEKFSQWFNSCCNIQRPLLYHLVASSLFLWAEAVATACYTLNRSLVHTLHGKTYYELLKGKKPNLQYFRVFGSLCYPTNDYDDVGKLKAKADIVQARLLNQMTSVTNSTELELTALQSGRSRSELVKDPEPPSVPPTKKQVDDLFQWFDDDEVVPIPPVVPITPVIVPAAPAPENANGSPSTTVISEGAPAEAGIDFGGNPLLLVARLDAFRLFIAHASASQNMIGFVDPEILACVRPSQGLQGAVSILLVPPDKQANIFYCASRPDIVFAVCMCARYQAKPTEMHLTAIKRIFRYLKGTITWFVFRRDLRALKLKALQMRIIQFPRERFATLLPLLGVKQMSPETLKELLDESVSESHGRTVADSIADMILWNAEERDVVPPGCSIRTVIIDPHRNRGYVTEPERIDKEGNVYRFQEYHTSDEEEEEEEEMSEHPPYNKYGFVVYLSSVVSTARDELKFMRMFRLVLE
ncbi:hypothetical protein Tco_0472064, partial [Tanacetum coccineum]